MSASRLVLALTLAVLVPGAAHAQIEPQRTANGRGVIDVFQELASWGWERVLVGQLYVEDLGQGASIQHWMLSRDYDGSEPFILAPGRVAFDGLESFLASGYEGAMHVAVHQVERSCDPVPTCVTLSRDSGAADALIRESEPERNFGRSGSLTVSSRDLGTRHALLRFDLDRIPRGAVIVSADLALSGLLYGASTNVFPVAAPWDEATVTWSSFARSGAALGAGPAGPYVARVAASMPFAGAGSAVSTSLVDLVQAWADGALDNHGVLLDLRDAGTMVVFASSENPDPRLRPALTVCFEACEERCDERCASGTVCVAGECRVPEGGHCLDAMGGSVCSDHGLCVHDRCFCDPGYDGALCEAEIGCPEGCSGAGQCFAGRCFCEPGHSGIACEVGPDCAVDCGEHGVCGNGRCFCEAGYGGDDCTEQCR